MVLQCTDGGTRNRLSQWPSEGYLGCFQFLAIMNEATVNISDIILHGHKFSQESGKYLGTQLPDHMAWLCLALWKSARLSLRGAAPFCSPTSSEESCCCLCILTGFGYHCALEPGRSVMYTVVPCHSDLHTLNDKRCGTMFNTWGGLIFDICSSFFFCMEYSLRPFLMSKWDHVFWVHFFFSARHGFYKEFSLSLWPVSLFSWWHCPRVDILNSQTSKMSVFPFVFVFFVATEK